jgi:hypothetical protein
MSKYELTNNDSMLLSQLMQKILDDKRWGGRMQTGCNLLFIQLRFVGGPHGRRVFGQFGAV